MIIKLIPAVISIALISSCSHRIEYHGKNLNTKSISNIIPNKTSKEQLLEIIGPASVVSSYENDKWYYVSFKREIYGFMPTRILQTKIVAIDFDKDKVSDVSVYKIAGGNKVSIDDETTISYGTEQNIISHFSKNFRRFSNDKGGKKSISKPRGI